MSREVKLGILALAAVATLIWGYKFLLGKNLLSSSDTYYIEYGNIAELNVSDPVTISGYQVGTVQRIELKPEDLRTVLVTIDVKSEIKLPRNTVAELRTDGVMGGRSIILQYSGICDGDCHESGDYLKGTEYGLIQSMVSPNEIGQYVDVVRDGLRGVVDSLGPEGSGEVAEITRSFSNTIRNLESATQKMNYLFGSLSGNLVTLVDNLNAVTGQIRDNSDQIDNMLSDLAAVTKQLKNARVDSTIQLANQAIAGSGATIEQMDVTLQEATKTIAEVQKMLAGINEGEGTLGKLAHDEELYGNINRASKELELLLEDFRLHPKRYIRGFLGNKAIPYEAPPNTVPKQPVPSGKGNSSSN